MYDNYESKLDGIAIIGISCRFPMADNMEEFWENLCNGKECISFFTKEEVIKEGGEVYKEILNDPNYVTAGGVINDIDMFDSNFFDYNPNEAEIMDPQQRLFLTCSWEALEDAGYYKEDSNNRIGVFAGSSISTYFLNNLFSRDFSDIVRQMMILQGNDKDHLTTRVSYKLNLTGPSINIQNACSTSLVAVHQACQSILNGECDIALAGGVSIKTPQKSGYIYQEGNILSPDGHCRPFDANANGTVFGNGAGVIVLKLLENAVEDRDNIYAVIKGTAVNNDGNYKVGYTAPSEYGQISVISEALAVSGVTSDTIDYVETHGTGTSLGDPIELNALKKVYLSETARKNFCAIGSVKANIGHLDRAAGIAGLIKVVLSLKNKKIPPSINYSTPNPQFDLSNSPFYVNTELKNWTKTNGKRRAGISSFGIGGTNAHAILEEAPNLEYSNTDKCWNILTISAKTEDSLEGYSIKLANFLKENSGVDMANVAYTLQLGRKPFLWRKIIVSNDSMETYNALNLDDSEEILTNMCQLRNRDIVFMFSGQGSQYVNMARELYVHEMHFKKEMDECFRILKEYSDIDFQNILYPSQYSNTGEELIKQTKITQPLIFIIEYALAKTLINLNIIPNALIGHSIGEYTAACLSGVLTLHDAIYIVTKRGELMQRVEGGLMLSIDLPEKDIGRYLNEDISLALINSDSLSVVSGTTEAIEELYTELGVKKISSRILQTSHAFHSHMMKTILDDFRNIASNIQVGKIGIPYISNVTGNWITEEEVNSSKYWVRHLRSTVRFADGIKTLFNYKDPIFLEVGPGNALCTFVKQIRNTDIDKDIGVVSTLPHALTKEDSMKHFLKAVGKLWLYGTEVKWETLHAGRIRNRLSLPKYQWDMQRYWIESDYNINPGNLIEETGVAKNETTKERLHKRPNILTSYREPRNSIECLVAEIWQDIFKIENIGIYDNYFELGGHSLMATQLVSRLNNVFGIEIPLRELFEATNIAETAKVIEDRLLNVYEFEESDIFSESIIESSAMSNE